MPLYDGDNVNLLTPDGRPVTMPGGLAALFPGLQSFPEPPPVAPPVPALDQTGTAPPAAPAIAPPAAPPPPPAEGPITDPSQLPAPTGTPSVPKGPVTSPAEDAGPPRAPVPTPAAPPPTNQQLAKNYAGRAIQESDRAADEERAGVMRSAQIQADEATREGQRLAQRDAETDRILQERAKQAAANEAELNKRITARDQLADQIAKTRVDRSVDHPIWAQIGLVLSMLGTAMTRRPGEAWNDPAYNTLMQLIDRKVQGQVADLDQKRAALAQMNVGVAEQRQHNIDRLTEIDARRDAAIQQAQQAVQTIATQMKAPAAVAGAQQLLGKLDQERAKLHAEYGQKAQDQINTEAARAQTLAMHRESLGMQYTIHRETLEANEREKMAQVAAQLLKEGKAEAAAKAKAVAEGGLFDPRTRDPLLNPAGQAKFKQADQLEAMARQQQDPALAARQKQQAEALRMSARINDSIVVDPKIATPLRDKIGTAQEVTDAAGDLIAKLEQNPSAFDREQWAGIATQMGDLANKYQKTIGEKISVRAFEQTMKHILEFDPDSYFHREANQSRAIESLKQLKGIVANDVNAALGKEGIKTEWKPLAKGEGENDTRLDLSEKTATEVGREDDPGWFPRMNARIATLGTKSYNELFPEVGQETADRVASRPGWEAGLSPNAVTHIKALATKAQTAGDAQYGQIVDTFKNSIADGLKDDSRVEASLGVIDVLGSSNPGLRDAVIAALPEVARERVQRLEAARRPATNVPRVPSRFDPDSEQAAAAAAADEQARRDAAFAPFRPGYPLQNSPGAGPVR